MRQARSLFLSSLLGASFVVGDVVYVTDLPLFSSLADCAGGALSYYVQSQTYNNCPEAVTALQQCVCSQDNNFAAVGSRVSSGVLGSCSATATEDLASAMTVYSAYCNQNNMPTFPTPATPVTQYPTDIPELSYLAPCAASAISYAVQSMTYNFCPSAATALATCACSKNQNSLRISQSINTYVKTGCSSQTADISSAQAFFAAYCAMNNGTSSFPTPSSPPGQMTYYITALPEYSSLATCARNVVSYAVQSQTYELCPEGPGALASCACIKSGMSSVITSSISYNYKYYCDSTASALLTSALNVFDYYCSAVRAEVTPNGVSESIAESTPVGSNPSGANGGGGGGGGSNASASRSKSGTAGAGNTSGADSTNGTTSGPKTAVIAGAVVGVVGGLALIGAAIFFIFRAIRKSKMDAALAAAAAPSRPGTAPDNSFPGKAELGGNPLLVAPTPPVPPVSPSPSMLKAGVPPRAENVSPASAHLEAPPLPGSAELAGQGPFPPPSPNRSELQGQGGFPYHQGPAHAGAELQGQGAMYVNRPELQGQGGGPYHQGPAHTSAELQGQGAAYPGRPELQGHGAVYPGRPELAGQYAHPQPPGPGQAQEFYAPQGPYPPQQQPPSGQPPMGWQSGPLQGYHEMDAGYPGPGAPGNPGQAR
ncbi:hypothetical protein GQ53DRAFT_783686 [Thozetella sp. PMI_491]|nr:hypothetical protein GQ53DRAFT_783686 [Thozetella sp. PMI_491]